MLIERNEASGMETSSRNSEVSSIAELRRSKTRVELF